VARQPLLQWLAIEAMDRDTFKNWVKVMQALEEAGKTDSYIYYRAKSIVTKQVDPGAFGPLPKRGFNDH
jgi:hypothetical protein